jgi:hypothetical protein
MNESGYMQITLVLVVVLSVLLSAGSQVLLNSECRARK